MSRQVPVMRALGVARSLTHHFKRLKPKPFAPAPSSTDKERLLEPGAAVASVELISMPPRWVDRYDSIVEDLDQLSALVEELRSEQKRRLSTTAFGDTESVDASIASISGEVAAIAQKCRGEIQSLGLFAASPSDELSISSAKKATASRLQELTTKCKKLQQEFYTKRVNYDSHAELIAAEEPQADDDLQTFDETEMWRDRSKDVDVLLKNFSDLAEIFKELNELVIEQGNILDRIDYNVEVAKVETEKAVVELEKVRDTQANRHQKSTRATCCLIFLIGSICMLVMALFLKHI